MEYDENSVEEVKRSIKVWEHKFQGRYDRAPSKEDIRENDKVHELYRKYRQLKNPALAKPKKPNKDQGQDKSEFQTQNNMEISHTDFDIENSETSTIVANAELGPTPQANGRIVSIFDVNMTPPDSSPLVPKGASMNSEAIFKTPTKLALQFKHSNLTSDLRTPLSEKLNRIKEDPETPTRLANLESNQMTPYYLVRGRKKKESSDESNPFHDNTSVTPKRTAMLNFLISPSPLKTHRFMNKKISDIYNDFKSIQAEDLEEILLDETIEQDTNENSPVKHAFQRPRKMTQKRTVKRWKIKPRGLESSDDVYNKLDIHEEISKIDEKARNKLEAYINSDSEQEDEVIREDVTDKKGIKKVKPVNRNYRRLKINDPRAKAFKQRRRR